MAATHYREPQEVIVAGLDFGQDINCRTSVLLQSTERRRDTARRVEVSEMETEIKRWRRETKRLREPERWVTHENGQRCQKCQSVIKKPWFIFKRATRQRPAICHPRRAGSTKQPDHTKQLSCYCLHPVFAVCPTMLKWQWKFSVLPKVRKDHAIHCHWRNKWDKCPQGERQTGNQSESNLGGFRFCLGAQRSKNTMVDWMRMLLLACSGPGEFKERVMLRAE